MKIARIEHHAVAVNQGGSWVFVQVHTDAGLTGLGELNPSAPRGMCLDALGAIGDALKGSNPLQTEDIHRRFPSADLDRPTVHALSAIEQALWDIRGQVENCPIHELFGGACRDQIRLYANISRILVDATPEEFAGNAMRAVADGFDAVKIAPFANPRFADDRPGDIDHGIACARAVRQAIGSDIDLLVDCYGRHTREEGVAIASALRELNLFWLEEPVADDDVQGYLAVREIAGSTPIAGGERFMFHQGFEPALKHQTMDIVMPDATVVGGLAELQKVATAASSHGIQTSPHGPFGPVVVAAHVQAMAAHADFQILEYAWGQVPWRADLLHPIEAVGNGYLPVPNKPGLGCTLNMDVVEAHRLH